MKSVESFRFKVAELGKFKTNEVNPVIEKVKPGCRLIGLTLGNFSLIDLIHGILKKTGKAHVVCATWSAGIKDANQVRWMLDTDLVYSFRLLTDHSYKTRQHKYAVSIDQLFGRENIRTSEIHAKFTLIHNEMYHIIIRTSMNLNANKTCETFEIDDDIDIFNFYISFVNHTFGTMPSGFVSESNIVNKSLHSFFFNEQPKQSALWTEI
jgi:hypothetical protein